MADIVSKEDFSKDDIKKIYSSSKFDILAIVAGKAYEKEGMSSSSSAHGKPEVGIIDKPIIVKETSLPVDHNSLPNKEAYNGGCSFTSLHKKQEQEVHQDEGKKSCETGVQSDDSKAMKSVNVCSLQGPKRVLHPKFEWKIAQLGGSDAKLVIEKRLVDSDVSEDFKSMLTMPVKQCNVDLDELSGKVVRVIEPANNLQQSIMTFDKLKSASCYVFTYSWGSLVKNNGLKVNDLIQVWSFRVNQAPGVSFVLVKLRS